MVGRRRLILASASPRRQELLSALGLEFDVVPSDAEEVHPPGCGAEGAATSVALAKALTVLSARPDAVVLGADTMVVGDDPGGMTEAVYYGKPADSDDAVRMLSELSGRVHGVVTGAAVVWRSGVSALGPTCGRTEAITTRVRFRELSHEEIAAYVATAEPMDKAGAYAIQGGAAAFVEIVEGDYFNVVGLSLASVRRLLRGLTPCAGPLPPVPPTPYRVAQRSRRYHPADHRGSTAPRSPL